MPFVLNSMIMHITNRLYLTTEKGNSYLIKIFKLRLLGGSVGKRPTSAQVMISQFVSSSPTSGSVLTAQTEPGGCFGFCASLSLCPPLLMLSHSLKNK